MWRFVGWSVLTHYLILSGYSLDFALVSLSRECPEKYIGSSKAKFCYLKKRVSWVNLTIVTARKRFSSLGSILNRSLKVTVTFVRRLIRHNPCRKDCVWSHHIPLHDNLRGTVAQSSVRYCVYNLEKIGKYPAHKHPLSWGRLLSFPPSRRPTFSNWMMYHRSEIKSCELNSQSPTSPSRSILLVLGLVRHDPRCRFQSFSTLPNCIVVPEHWFFQVQAINTNSTSCL